MSDGTSAEHIAEREQEPPVDEQRMAADSPLPMVDTSAPPPIGDPMTPSAAEPTELAERGGEAEPVARPLPPFEPFLPTLEPRQSVHLDHLLPDESGPSHIRVACPSCGSQWQGDDLRPHAEWFCATCDFPLFWAKSGAPGGQQVDDALARLPGTDGREAMLSLACPACGEQNPPVPTANCLRCGSPLSTPEPILTFAPPVPIVIVPAEPVKQRRIWPWVLATCLLATALIVAIVVAYNRG
jgi:hypothetical protein